VLSLTPSISSRLRVWQAARPSVAESARGLFCKVTTFQTCRQIHWQRAATLSASFALTGFSRRKARRLHESSWCHKCGRHSVSSQHPIDLHFFSDESFRPLRDQFVESVKESGLRLRETFINDLNVNPNRAAGGLPVYLFKTELLIDALENTKPGDYFVISDVDVQFLGPVLPLVNAGINGRDVCFQMEFHKLGVNIGFMAVRHTDACLSFWRKVLDEIPRTGSQDQKIVNNLLYAQPAEEIELRWGRFPAEIWASSQVFDGGPPPPGVVFHHANWIKRAGPTFNSGGAPGASDPAGKIAQLKLLRSLVENSNRAAAEAFATDLNSDPALEMYHRRAFGELRSGVEWRALSKEHPARPGGSRRSKRHLMQA